MNAYISGAAYAALATLSLATFSHTAAAASGICNQTTASAKAGCLAQAVGDNKFALGVCANVTSPAAKLKCLNRAASALTEANALCEDQAAARAQVCTAIGQAAYEPVIAPGDFSTTINNPLLPMKPGDVHVYKNGDSTVTVTVTGKTRKLLGVTCIVVHDVNRVAGVVEEDTFDYYAQKNDGSVWYFGEDSIAFTDGVADTHGSWRAGVDGAKPGITMPASPPLNGKTYRQEFALGEAEDIAKNISGNHHVVVPLATYNNAYQIRETTPIEPDLKEDKYYVPGIGNVLAIDRVTGEREELVSFTPGP